jgi:DNA-binding GntR family transcriptional regulator
MPEPDVQSTEARLRRADLLDPAELREINPAVLLLESVAVRESPPFSAEAIAELRAVNQRLLDSAGDATEAAKADDAFHRRLIADCGNPRLLEVVEPVRRAMAAYERAYMLSTERLMRSVEEHEAIIAALERGDHTLASELVRENYTSGMPEFQAELEDHDRERE